MQKKEKGESKGKKRKPYQKPALTVEELFEATVLACGKTRDVGCGGRFRPRRTS